MQKKQNGIQIDDTPNKRSDARKINDLEHRSVYGFRTLLGWAPFPDRVTAILLCIKQELNRDCCRGRQSADTQIGGHHNDGPSYPSSNHRHGVP